MVRVLPLLLALSVLAASCVPVVVPVPVAVGSASTATRHPTLSPGAFGVALNAWRAERGLAPLRRSPVLDRVARAHMQDMVDRGYFSHVAPDGSGPMERVRRAGYRACRTGETIARGQDSPRAVLRSWTRSPPHRRQLRTAEARDYGIARGPGGVWVLLIARPGC